MAPNPLSAAELAAQAERMRPLAELLVRAQDSEDLVQDTLVAALSQRERPRALGPWLRTVLRNRARARARTQGRRLAREREAAALRQVDPAPDEELGRDELISAMCEALECLDEPYREVLRERFFDEREPSQIAARLDCAPATVRWRVHEGLRRLRLELDDRFGGRGQWLGALALAFAIPAPAQAAGAGLAELGHRSGAKAMKHTSIKTFVIGTLALTGLAGLAALFFTRRAPPSRHDEGSIFASTNLSDLPSASERGVAASESPTLAAPSSGAFTSASTELEGECNDPDCVWSLPEFAHCADLVDPDKLEEPLQIKVIWQPDGEGHVPEVTVTSGCYEPNLCSGVERTPCEEGQTPTEHPEIAACVHAKVVLRGPPNLAIGELWGVTQYIDPTSEDECEDGCDEEPVALPPASEGASELGPLEAIAAWQLPAIGAQAGGGPVILECGSYSCPYSDQARGVLDEVLAAHPEARVYWFNFVSERDARSVLMAKAAIAANEQGKLLQLHDLLFDRENLRDEADLREAAEAIGMDLQQFQATLHDPATAQRLADERAFCAGQGVHSTPSFVIDGELVTGVRPAAELAELLAGAETLDDNN